MREEKKMSQYDESTISAMKAAGAAVPVFVTNSSNKKIPVSDFAAVGDQPLVAIYGETSYNDVVAMLNGGSDNNGAVSKGVPLLCVLRRDTDVTYLGETYDTLSKGTTLAYSGSDTDGIHFAHSIAHSTGGSQPPIIIYVEAILNSQNLWSLKLRSSFQISGLSSGSGSAVVKLTPGMSSTATLVLEGDTSANTRSYMLLPTSVTQGPPKVANLLFIGFDLSGGMTPCMGGLLSFAGMTKKGVTYPGQTPKPHIFTTNSSPDAGIASLDITVYQNNDDLFGANLRIGTEFLAIAQLYDRTKTYAVGDFCITSSGLWKLKTAYTAPQDFTKANWEKKTLIELLAEKLAAVSHDSTLSGDGTASNPLSVAGGGGGISSVSHDSSLTGDGTSENPLSVADDGKIRSLPNVVSLCEVQSSAANKIGLDSLSLMYTKSGLIKIIGYISVSSSFTPSYSSNDKGGSQYWPSLFVIDVTDYPDIQNWTGNSIMVDRSRNGYLPIQFTYNTVNDRRYLSINANRDITVQIGNKEFLPYWM